MKHDISGYATKFNVLCSDGRVIDPGAFVHQNGTKVPLVWGHRHDDPDEVLGHGYLFARPDGMWIEAVFNDTRKAATAKTLVGHGDITDFSIYANGLKHQGNRVMHGDIKEVSLVLSGANPEACIVDTAVSHEAGQYSDEGVAYIGQNAVENHIDEPEEDTIKHSDDSSDDLIDIWNSMTDKQKKAAAIIAAAMSSDDSVSHDGTEPKADEGTEPKADDNLSHSGMEDNSMKKNIFDQSAGRQSPILSHDAFSEIMEITQEVGSMKKAVGIFCEKHQQELSDVLAHSTVTDPNSNRNDPNNTDARGAKFGSYGVEEIDLLFPEARGNAEPKIVPRDDEWVGKVLSGVAHSPFSRVRTRWATIDIATARAKGYITGNIKTDVFFRHARRSVTPTTIYIKTKLDRDDILDITEFDIVRWVKKQMRVLFNEELAHAILMGDGRPAIIAGNANPDKIDSDHIHPIITEPEPFIRRETVATDPATGLPAINEDDVALAIRDKYRGSGRLSMFFFGDNGKRIHNEMLFKRDLTGHRMYKTDAELAAACCVDSLIDVPYTPQNLDPDPITGDDFSKVWGLAVALSAYQVGADKGGELATFDDFDLDVNQYKYLMETRVSGAMTDFLAGVVFFQQ